MAVYDDVRGWNTEQYLGQGEFYLEYGRFDVSLTVPANMLVGGDGHAAEPRRGADRRRSAARLARARTSDSTVDHPRQGRDRPTLPPGPRPASGMLTWHFTADSVRDFAWAAARHFIWDAVRVNGGQHARHEPLPAVRRLASGTRPASTPRLAIEHYSTQWFPYPYPYATNVNGIEGGMEYPMIVFCANRTERAGALRRDRPRVRPHLVPDGRRQQRAALSVDGRGLQHLHQLLQLAAQVPATTETGGTAASWVAFERPGRDREPPIMTRPTACQRRLGQVAYNKPAVGLVMLRDQITGPERFDPAFREYIRRWAFKHPTPADFFRTMKDGAGRGPRLVLALVVLHHRQPRPGGGFGAASDRATGARCSRGSTCATSAPWSCRWT